MAGTLLESTPLNSRQPKPKLFDCSILGDTQGAVDFITNVLESSTEYSIIGQDLEGGILLWNEGARRLYGYEPDDVVGKANFSILHVPEDVKAGKPQQILETVRCEGKWEGAIERMRKDGSRFTAHGVITPRRDAGERTIGFLLISEDITDRIHAELKIRSLMDDLATQRMVALDLARDVEEFRQRAKRNELALTRVNQELARSNLDLEQFAYVASHDLHEPLRAVSGCAQVLQRRYQHQLDQAADELIRHTVEGAGRMQTMITDLLAYARVSTRREALQPTHCEAVLNQALANLEVAVRDATAVVTYDALPVVPADPGQLTQLLQNLIGNALKFRGTSPPRIHVGAERQNGDWRFFVKDNGIGIQSEYAERIFAVFQRLHTRNEYPGTGIGLSICKKIVERHGGRIWVESEPEKGSTFYFTIPQSGADP